MSIRDLRALTSWWLHSTRINLRNGRQDGFPICCRWRWTIEYAINPDRDMALERGIRFTADDVEFVPCNVFHKAAITHAEHERLLNVPGTSHFLRAIQRLEREP
jgi:hypothetical protein